MEKDGNEIVTLELTRDEVSFLVANMSVANSVTHFENPDVVKFVFVAAGCKNYGIPIANKIARALGMTEQEYKYDRT